MPLSGDPAEISRFKLISIISVIYKILINSSIYFILYTIYICIYFTCLVSLFVSNKRQNGRTDKAQILCGMHMTHGKVYGGLKMKNVDCKKRPTFTIFENAPITEKSAKYDLQNKMTSC